MCDLEHVRSITVQKGSSKSDERVKPSLQACPVFVFAGPVQTVQKTKLEPKIVFASTRWCAPGYTKSTYKIQRNANSKFFLFEFAQTKTNKISIKKAILIFYFCRITQHQHFYKLERKRVEREQSNMKFFGVLKLQKGSCIRLIDTYYQRLCLMKTLTRKGYVS